MNALDSDLKAAADRLRAGPALVDPLGAEFQALVGRTVEKVEATEVISGRLSVRIGFTGGTVLDASWPRLSVSQRSPVEIIDRAIESIESVLQEARQLKERLA